ncbi:hypothetical protein TWF730_006205 [Orbilia blumenaviensis]|uniref:Uncharacterized protein n=1 Tax=Orbilia blumenaviensis TaxID=1796055 RepID=A0AAV9VGM6_9PEZI
MSASIVEPKLASVSASPTNPPVHSPVIIGAFDPSVQYIDEAFAYAAKPFGPLHFA